MTDSGPTPAPPSHPAANDMPASEPSTQPTTTGSASSSLPPNAQRSGSRESSPPRTATFELSQAIREACNRYVERYRAGTISKAGAFLGIHNVIGGAAHSQRASHQSAVEAFDSYIEILDNFDEFRRSAAARGSTSRHRDDQATPGGENGGGNAGHAGGGAESEDEADENTGFFDSAQKRNSEWTNILAGRSVDLDHVLSGIHAIAPDTRARETLGSLEIITGSSVTAKKVSDHSSWTIAWGHYSQALKFVFPHRESELDSYAAHINQLFAAVPTTMHSRIIDYDKAVRLHVTARRDISLTDTTSFADIKQEDGTLVAGGRLADAGTEGGAQTLPQHASTLTSVQGAGTPATSLTTAQARRSDEHPNRFNMVSYCPRHARDFIWEENEQPRVTLALASEHFNPMPPVPTHKLSNSITCHTISSYPYLFQVVSPIRISVLNNFLVSHPNQPFVRSVCEGLIHGFWPWADTSSAELPVMLDMDEYIRDPAHLAFAEEQCRIEISFGTFSPTFSSLLPGMLSVPVTIATKAHSEKLRLCVNHSAEPAARNSLIPKCHVSVPLDNLHDLSRALCNARASLGPDSRIVLWKSNVKRAYRCIPMHPLWQIKQVVKLDGSFNVDRNNNFGSRAGGSLWGRVFSLVLWIGVYIICLADLLAYVDVFSWDIEGNLVMYSRYNRLLPAKQANFLHLLDILNIPHDKPKQQWGPTLTIIGFEVNANTMTITMPEASKFDLLASICDFATHGRRHTLSAFQELAGWINWALNVFPLLCPGLCTLYHKMAGNQKSSALIWVNQCLCAELHWVTDHIKNSGGCSFSTLLNGPLVPLITPVGAVVVRR
ncbi:unnamed protein product [Cyclocybe aegerita]|uniref:Uncharacterized protein n=1 Tax=Cyclocybe aegerita TaxID=1973307 RepID=A0A8S0X7H1_CYCAE|nr:unnamed protein product [Cyclocybe aegerita]